MGLCVSAFIETENLIYRFGYKYQVILIEGRPGQQPVLYLESPAGRKMMRIILNYS
jgi:hypothetical protein